MRQRKAGVPEFCLLPFVCLLISKGAEGTWPTPSSPLLTLMEFKSLIQDLHKTQREDPTAHRTSFPNKPMHPGPQDRERRPLGTRAMHPLGSLQLCCCEFTPSLGNHQVTIHPKSGQPLGEVSPEIGDSEKKQKTTLLQSPNWEAPDAGCF